MPSLCWWMAGLFREVSVSPLGPPALLDFVLVASASGGRAAGRGGQSWLAGRGGRASHTAGGTPNIFRTFSEHFPNTVKHCRGNSPPPGGAGEGAPTSSEHFPNISRTCAGWFFHCARPASPGTHQLRTFSEHFPDIIGGFPCPGEGWGMVYRHPDGRPSLSRDRVHGKHARSTRRQASTLAGWRAGWLMGRLGRLAGLLPWLAGWLDGRPAIHLRFGCRTSAEK